MTTAATTTTSQTNQTTKPATPSPGPGSSTPASQPRRPVKLGLTVTGIVNDVFQTKKGGYAIKLSAGNNMVTVFSSKNGLYQGDIYSAILHGLTANQYGELSGRERERF